MKISRVSELLARFLIVDFDTAKGYNFNKTFNCEGERTMRKFLIVDQNQKPLVNTRWNEFTCGILELAGIYVVRVATPCDGHSYTAAVYRDIKEAAEAVAELKDFALAVDKENEGFLFPVSEDPVTALDVVDSLS